MRVLPSASSLACLSWLVLAACETAPQPDDKSGKDDTDAGDSADASGIPAPQLAFEPAAPVTADDIVLVVGNQGTYDVFVDWRSDGQQQTAFRNVLTIPAANTAKGQTWQATVTLRRGDAVGPPATLSVEIGNTAPTVTLTIQPEAPTASDSLRLEVLQDDPDGDPLERSVSWTKNGRDFNPGATPEAIAASFLERGDTWAVVLEVRDPDGAVAEARDEVVVGNSPPVVTIADLSPLTPDTTATLTGRVVRQDPDGDVGLVDTIEWFVRSKGTTTSVLKGDALQLDAQASRAGDEVWFTVSVSDGLPGGVSAPVESNHVIIRNTAPLIETVAVSPEAPTVRAAISCVPSGWTDIDGDPEGYRYSWTKDGVLIPGADQAQLPPSAFARGDSIACTATPFDGTSAGQPVGSEPVEVRNALPYLNSVAVSPGAPGVKTELVAVLDPPEGIDPDGDTVSFRYQWQAWGENIAGASGATLPGPHKAKDRIRVVVTPYDSFGDDGLDVPSGLLEIGNVRPVVTDVQIDPASPTVNSILKAIPVASDADDQPLTFRYVWEVDRGTGTPVAVLSGEGRDQLTPLDPDTNERRFVAGDRVRAKVTPHDGFELGSQRTSDWKTIGNSPPRITRVDLTPLEAYEDSLLACTPVGWTDADGEPESYLFEWYRVTQLTGVRTAIGTGGPTLNTSFFRRDDAIECDVTPRNGVNFGTRLTSNRITVLNTAPVLESVALSTLSPEADDTLECFPGRATDKDLDVVTFLYRWEVNGEAVANTKVLDHDLYGAGDSIYCEVTPTDGSDLGAPVRSLEALAANGAPVIQSVSLTPLSPRTDEPIHVDVSVTDADGTDDLVFTYEWTVSSQVVADTDDTLDTSYTKKGDLVRVKVKVEDPTGETAELTSLPVQVRNSIPTISSAALDPGVIYEATQVRCVPSGWNDPDGDPEGYRYAWLVDDFLLGQASSSTLDGNRFSRGSRVKCRVRPYDGDDSVGPGSPVDSPVVTVWNTPPTLEGVSISPTTATESTTLFAEVGSSADDDGDTVSFTYRWFVDDVEVATTQSITGARFDKGQTVKVEATPRDDAAAGAPRTSTGVLVGNSPPQVLSVTLGPPNATVETPIVAQVDLADLDPADAGNLSVHYTWIVDGQDAGIDADTLPVGAFTGDSVLRVEVQAFDGTALSPVFVSGVLDISNSPPSITEVIVTPTDVYETTTLICSAGGYSDPDGDPPPQNAFQYRWKVNGTTRAASASISGTVFKKGDEIVCEVTPYDGFAFGTPVTSAPVTVKNSKPTAQAVALSRTQPKEADIIVPVVTAAFDADGDTITRTYAWFVGGSQVSTASSLTGADFDKGQQIYLKVTLTDTEGAFNTYTTSTVTAVNTAPTVATLDLDPTEPYTFDDIEVVGTVSDPDPADAANLTLSYVWHVNDAPVAAVTGTVLTSDHFVKGDEIFVRATAHDGVVAGAPRESALVIVQNSIPTLDDIVLEGPTVDKRASPWCQVDVVDDADGEQVFVLWEWRVNGVLKAETQWLPTDLYVRTDVVQCFATPFDGDDFGSRISSEPVTVSNAPPSIASVLVNPQEPQEISLLTAQLFGVTDVDGDAVSTSLEWFVNDVQVSTAGAIDGVQFSRGDVVRVEATPFDGYIEGPATSSVGVEVLNTPPVMPQLPVISPSVVRTDTLLTASASGTDADVGDVVTFVYEWKVNGTSVQSGSTATLAPSYFVKGDTVSVTARPYDGQDYGIARTATIGPIPNSPPGAPAVTAWPAKPVPGQDDLFCQIATPAADADNDALTYSFVWKRGQGESTATVVVDPLTVKLPAANVGIGDTWLCLARAHDGEGYGPWSEVASIGVGDGGPRSCKGHFDLGGTTSGVYTIDVDGYAGATAPFDVYCDQTTQDGGWTRVIRTTGSNVDFGQKTSGLVNSYAAVNATQGIYESFAKVRIFTEVMIKQVSGQQAGKHRAFANIQNLDKSMLDLLKGCRDEAVDLTTFSFEFNSDAASHTTTLHGAGYAGDLMIYPNATTGSPAPVKAFAMCGVNKVDENDTLYHDISYMAFIYETLDLPAWARDTWRGQTQAGTIWSLANGDYDNAGDAHIGTTSMQTLAGWKGEAGMLSGTQHQGTYEIYVR